RNEEAAKSLSLALGREGGGSRGRRFETLSGLFIKAAVAAPHCALVPLQAYLPPEQPDACGSSHSRNSRGPLSTRRDQEAGGALAPVFRIVLRPRSPPWPMRLVIPRKTDTWTLAFYCTPRQPGPAASEAPHVLSNASTAAWRGLEEALPPGVSRSDFEVLSEGWQREGRGPEVFSTLARDEWRERHSDRRTSELSRQQAARELEEWLSQLGLLELAPLLLSEGVDLETVLEDTDLIRMNVGALGTRRMLLNARSTVTHYKQLRETIARLEAEAARKESALREALLQARSAAEGGDAATARASELAEQLRAERERSAGLQLALDEQAECTLAEAARGESWREHALAFAHDLEAVQERQHALAEAQRSIAEESHRSIQSLLRRQNDYYQRAHNPSKLL
uniref:SAM domain-containing protein n=2 Tax=Emiliania huxleyi TaxID=2903 RepID=A0A0D3IKH1_EMIH1